MSTSKSILVVEDVEAERTLISAYLRQHGYRLFHAHDGLDGINKARLLIPDHDTHGCRHACLQWL